ncbi:hypothetical protein [Actinopolymorpha alba]|uniref:hypothetical protein n=1 Tax=Actinopolymorpha alba TaxID=533267 RepID=UPI00039DF461|nr:hypothetical protein [Actinopolymorpha alba]
MTYRVAFAAGAAAQFHNLPEHARDAVVHRAADLAERPWNDVTVLPPGDNLAFREAVFGNGHGLLAVHVDEVAELIRIFNVVWLG